MTKSYFLPFIFFCVIISSCKKDEPSFIQANTIPQVVGQTYTASEITAFKQMTIYATNGIVIKLPRRVSIYLVDTAYSSLTNELDSMISELNTLLDTNLIISRTTNIVGSTLKVYITNRNTYEIAEPQTGPYLESSNFIGLAHLNWDHVGGEIYNGSAFVDIDRAGPDFSSLSYIIHHEIMHTLGFYGHVSLPEFNSVLFAFRGFPFPTIYTSFDKKMMKLLYNPAVKAGMNEQQLNAVVVNL